MKLGLVTWLIGKDMDCHQLIELCQGAGLAGVELRQEHAHKVEVSLSKQERAEVKALFAGPGVEIAGLGGCYEYHSKDPEEVKKNIEGSKAYAQLAADVGAPGIKVRPNDLYDDVPHEQTQEQIGKALREVAAFAEGVGVKVRLEVHGPNGSNDPRNIRKIMDACDHPNAYVCWNSNKLEQDENGSIQWCFDLLKDKIDLVHITDIGVYQYPWQQLFDNLKGIHYQGYCLAEMGYNPEPLRFMQYYRTLFDLYTGNYRYPQPK